MAKILVTGANGQLGNCLRALSSDSKHRFIFTDVEELDITDKDSVKAMFEHERPDWIINTAAYTAVDKAEGDIEKARLTNSSAPANIAQQSREIGAKLVHISTDYVFGGDDPNPLNEDSPTDPRSVYGQTKLEGEAMAALNPKHIIIRTSWLYSIYGNNFVKTMRRLGKEKNEINVVSDQWGCPTSAHDLAKAIMLVIENPVWGIFHFSNEGTTNWAIFAEEIMFLSKLECKVNHISSIDYPTTAKRPTFSIMDKSKFYDTFGMLIPEWEASLEEVIIKLEE